ncbi:aminoglycoside adenylyltransferase domain-containing protein [Bacillus sp. AK031]
MYSSINEVLNEYIRLWTERLPNQMEGLYLHGSIVLDAYIPGSSDIDFVVITKNRLTEKEIHILTDIHEIIARKFVKPELDGSFIVWEDLGKDRCEDNEFYPYYNGGKIESTTHFNPITWWLLKRKGISFLGPDITERPFNSGTRLLTSYVAENMNSYWAGRVLKLEKSIEPIKKWSDNDIDEEVEWTVLGLLRQYYTLKEYSITSKIGAGEYGLINLPGEWHDIIHEALHIRRKINDRVFNSAENRINETVKFSKFLIQHCNRIQQK